MTSHGDGAVLLEVLTTTPEGTATHAVAALDDVPVATVAPALARVLLGWGSADDTSWELVGPDGDRWAADATLGRLGMRDGTAVRLVGSDESPASAARS